MNTSLIQQAKSRLGIIGTAPDLNKAVDRAIRVAPTDLSVLVVGESGTGKEFFPRIIHQFSPRKHARFIAVNCGAIPEGTIDSELFGHEKGSFTGAVNSRKGYFEEANGGTIFLDEVAELPLTTQARLLRVLESGEYIRVGSSEVQKTNIRIVAATNVALPQAIAQGRFRQDLYYRLAAVSITVPPLRDRSSDILLLCRKFAADFAERYRTRPISFSDDAAQRLLTYRWPGNIRQLKNAVEQLALYTPEDTPVTTQALAEVLPEATATNVPALRTAPDTHPAPIPSPDDHSYRREREMLFSLIYNMKQQIEQLRADVDSLRDTLASASPSGSTYPAGPSDTRLASLLSVRSSSPAVTDVDPLPADGPSLAADEPPLSEKEQIRRALDDNSGRRKAAASQLGISERTLYRKIKEYGLE